MKLTKEQWTEQLDFGYNSDNLLQYATIDYLYEMSRDKNMKSVEWIKKNLVEYDDEKQLWWDYRFNNFEIWADDRLIIRVPANGHILINKNE